MGKPNNTVMTKNGIYDPTAFVAIKNVMVQAAKKNGRTITLQIDRKHREYTLTFVDAKGHKTLVSRTYEDEREIPNIY